MATRVTKLFEVSHPRRVVLVSGAHGVNEFYSIALPPILPLLVASFDIGYARAGLLVTVYFAMYTVFQLPVGYLADRIDKTWLIAGGMVGLAVSFLLASVAGSYPALLATQVLAGIAGSTYHPAGMSLVSDLESRETEGKAMGLHAAGGVAGTVLAPVLIGGIAALADWRLALRAAAVVGVGYAGLFGASYTHPTAAREVDAAGSASASVDGGDADNAGGASVSERIRGAAARGARMLLSWWVLGLVLSKVLFSLQFGAVRTYTTSYVFEASGGASALSNAVFFVLLAGGGVTAVWFGGLADRFDRGRLLAATFFASALFVAATLVLPRTPLVLMAWFLLVGGVVYAGLPVMNTLISQFSREGSSGSVFGIAQTASALGSAGAPVLFAAVASAYGIEAAFPAIAGVSLLGGVVLLAFASRVFS